MKIGKAVLGLRIKNDEIEKEISPYLEKIPPSHLKNLRGIYRSPLPPLRLFLTMGKKAYDYNIGFYQIWRNEVILFGKQWKDNLFHEIGHHIMNTKKNCVIPEGLKKEIFDCYCESSKVDPCKVKYRQVDEFLGDNYDTCINKGPGYIANPRMRGIMERVMKI
jgi:hypothetical protein